jgi:hypothetical protein
MCRYTISAETLRAAQAPRVLKQASNTPYPAFGLGLDFEGQLHLANLQS